ncbi:MAG: sugar ABC transporter permease [Lachnospiraceae bacterium]|nr:sugar ABC transporter permease [Lachnospiraceae bacterium]
MKNGKTKKPVSVRQKRAWATGFLFVTPSVLAMLCMIAYPLILVVVYSFCKVALPKFDLTLVGFDNFRKVLSGSQLPKIVWNTLKWTFISLLFRFILGFVGALIMQNEFRGRTLFRIITLIPWTMPSIVAANLWRWIYNADSGILNYVLTRIAPGAATNWLGNPRTALMAVIMAYVWMGFPYIMLMLVAGMQGIPKEYTEAAKIDGANSVQVFLHVTIPQLRSFIMILTLLEIISGFNSFDLIFTMTGGGPGIATETIGLNIYRTAFQNYNFGGASALGLILLIVVLIGFLLYAPSQKRRTE